MTSTSNATRSNCPVHQADTKERVHSARESSEPIVNGEFAPRHPRIATIVVTWNRRDSLFRALAAHASQHADLARVDMIVVDNASTDGTYASILECYRVDGVIENHGHDLDFDFRVCFSRSAEAEQHPHPSTRSTMSGSPRPHPFRSLTVLRNLENRGGTGGYNAGMAFVRDVLDKDPTDPVDFVWLLDDDAFVDVDTLSLQLAAMETDPRIGMVGARSVDPDDGVTTLESTVYFDWKTGHLMDDAPLGHPYHETHRKFLAAVGSARRGSNYSGLVDCDVCAAASLLARVSVLREIGLWNPRYFIYEDDADWCLRARRAGYRVVACMDAKIFHRTWHARLSPRLNCVRMFYVSRNRLWTMLDVMDEPHRSLATRDWHRTLLRFSLDAAWHRRATHSRLLLSALADSLRGKGGRCPVVIPPEQSIDSALRAVGALRLHARVAILCDRPLFADFAADMRSQLRLQLQPGEHEPRWIELARNDVSVPPPTCERVLYSSRLRSKLRRQLNGLTAIIVFDSAGDFPILSSCPTIHIDGPTRLAQVEDDALRARLCFTLQWFAVALRAWWSRLALASRERTRGDGFQGCSTTKQAGSPSVSTASSGSARAAH